MSITAYNTAQVRGTTFLSRFGENSALYLNTDCVSHCNAFSTLSLRKEFSKEFPCKQPE